MFHCAGTPYQSNWGEQLDGFYETPQATWSTGVKQILECWCE